MSRRPAPVTDGTIPDHHERSWTRQQFALAESISMVTYYNWKREGLGPDEYIVGGIARITPAARERWHRKMEKRAASKLVKVERERRQKIAATAAMISARGPNHISKQRQAHK